MGLHYVIGPPYSGKSTFVQEHRKPGDVVIDFDLIAQALGSAGEHGEHLTQYTVVTAMIWKALVRWCEQNRRVDSWIIHAFPSEPQVGFYRSVGKVTVMEKRG